MIIQEKGKEKYKCTFYNLKFEVLYEVDLTGLVVCLTLGILFKYEVFSKHAYIFKIDALRETKKTLYLGKPPTNKAKELNHYGCHYYNYFIIDERIVIIADKGLNYSIYNLTFNCLNHGAYIRLLCCYRGYLLINTGWTGFHRFLFYKNQALYCL
jgi:hypothetical protein